MYFKQYNCGDELQSSSHFVLSTSSLHLLRPVEYYCHLHNTVYFHLVLGRGFRTEKCNGSTHKCSQEWSTRMQELYRMPGNLATTARNCNSKLEINASYPSKVMLSILKLSFLANCTEVFPLGIDASVQKEWALFHKTPEADD